VQINNKMFACDVNQQAYIVDLKAGSYRQLVEGTESCQISIIHPDKPRNQSERESKSLSSAAALG
jgi:hypothetical protein